MSSFISIIILFKRKHSTFSSWRIKTSVEFTVKMAPILLFLLVTVLLLFVLYRVKFSRRDKLFSKIPSPPKIFLLHNTPQMFGLSSDKLLEKFSSWYHEFGDVFHITLHTFDDGMIVIADTKIAEVLSLSQPERSRALFYQPLSRWIGKNGFFLSKGDHLKNRMKIIAPVFSPKMFKRVNIWGVPQKHLLKVFSISTWTSRIQKPLKLWKKIAFTAIRLNSILLHVVWRLIWFSV